MGKATKLDEFVKSLEASVCKARKEHEASSKYIEGLEYSLVMAQSMQRTKKVDVENS